MSVALRGRSTAFGILAFAILGCSGSTADGPLAPPGDFTVVAALAAPSVHRGASVTISVTATRNGGFAGPIALAVTGLPAGVTAPTATIAVGASSASIELTVGGSAALGNHQVMVRATASGMAERAVSASFAVSEPPDFAIAALPAASSVNRGSSGTLNVTVTRTGGFNGPVSVSVTGLPTGVTAAPAVVAPDASTASISLVVAATTALGTHSLVVHANADGLGERTASVAVGITEPPDFTIAASLAAPSVHRGASVSVTVTATRTGEFSGPIDVSLSGLPAGVTGTVATIAADASSASLTIAVGGSAPLGGHDFVVRGTASGVGEKTMSASVGITEPPDFTIAASVAAPSVHRGASVSVTVTATRTGEFSGPIDVSLSGLPAGVTGTVATIAADASNASMTMSVGGSAPLGSHDFVVRGTASGVGEKTLSASVGITEPPGFSVTAVRSSLRVPRGGADSIRFTVNRMVGFTGAVQLAFPGLPSGVFVPTANIPADSAGVTLRLSVSPNSTVGGPVSWRGTGAGASERTGTLDVSVVSPFMIAADEFLICPQVDTSTVGQINCQYAIRTMTDYGLPSLATFTVQRAGVLHWDAGARRPELAAMSAQATTDVCTMWSAPSQTLPTPVRDYHRDMAGEQSKVQNINNELMNTAGWWLGKRNAAAAQWAVQTLLQLATAESMLGFNRDGNSHYEAKRMAMVSMNTIHALEDYPFFAGDTKVRIMDWLGLLVDRIDYSDAQVTGNTSSGLDFNNHGWFRDAVMLNWGTMQGRNALFQRSVGRYVSVLAGQVRPDGSVPAEAARASVATHYTSVALTAMIQYAEAAAIQGYDLYAMKVNGIDVHKMVDFFLVALEQPSEITQYSQRQISCSPEQCAGWATQDLSSLSNSGYNIAAWSEAYVRRFPNSPLTARLLSRFPRSTFKNMNVDVWGGISSCHSRAGG